MGKISRIGFFIGSLAIVLILFTSPTTAIPNVNSPTIQTNALSTSPSLEYVHLAAGINTAVYTNVFVFGGEGTSPVNVEAAGLAETAAWMLMYTQQTNFATYLKRAPSDLPDGLALVLVYPKTESNSLFLAAGAAKLFELKYDVNFTLLFASAGAGKPDIYAFSSKPDITLYSTVAGDVAGIHDQGFAALMDANTATSAKVSWAGYGVRNLDSGKVGMYGMGWIKTDGITATTSSDGTGATYIMSTQNVFGKSFDAVSSPAKGLSRVQFNIPYPITVISGGITPTTSNPLPHVTGKMMWDLRHPIPWYDLPASNDFSVSFKVNATYDFPNVQNEMVIDQNKLNNDGILEVLFNLKNIGEADAKNINLSLPVGPDFGKIARKNRTIWVIKDIYDVKESFSSDFNIDFQVTGTTGFNETVFTLQGWYNDTNGLADWNTSTSVTIYQDQATVPIIGTVINANLRLLSTNGFPQAFLDALDTHIVSKLSPLSTTNPVGSVTSIKDIIKNNLGKVLFDTFNDTLHTIYEKRLKFVFDEGNFTSVKKNVAYNPAQYRAEWFLEKTGLSLAAGESTSVSFKITDIPTTADRLALPYFTVDKSGTYPHATMTSKEQNYKQFMQYVFETIGWDARPISFRPGEPTPLGLDAYYSDVYGSIGMRFTWENAQGFPFFGMSNGQNLQLADDEAVISAIVSLDKQFYVVGDPVSISVKLTNNGDADASAVKVRLFHASLGRDWRFERVEQFATIDVGALAQGASTTVNHVVPNANSFLGYHPVFAVVEFTSEEGQALPKVPDFLNLYNTDEIEFAAGGQTHHFVMSTLTGALLISKSAARAPAIPEARLSMTSSVDPKIIPVGKDEFTLTIIVKNEGDASTTATISQAFDPDAFRPIRSLSTKGTVTEGTESVRVSDMSLAPGESATITITFNMLGSKATLPPAVADYTINGESSLGDSINTGAEISLTTSGATSLDLSAGAAAQQQSQKSATQDSSAAAYSASSSVGAEVNTVQNTEEQTVSDGKGFVGWSNSYSLSLMLIPLAFLSFIIRKRR